MDDRDTLTPPRKFFYHELRGVPLRLEIGPKDVAKNACVLVRRDTGEKIVGVELPTLVQRVQALMAQMHKGKKKWRDWKGEIWKR